MRPRRRRVDRYTMLRGDAPRWVGCALWVFLGAVALGWAVRWAIYQRGIRFDTVRKQAE